jgi:hypothetical protein
MAELLRTHLLGERAAGVRADGSLGLRANRDPELTSRALRSSSGPTS